jgi:oxygen-independent coproporphyrinogen-3 oxidase
LPTSLYVHVPFCVVKCGYCDFNSYEVDDAAVLDVYLTGLARELDLVSVPQRPTTVFIGGGTPSFFDPARLERFFALLRRHVDLDHVDEVTMEVNPESLTSAKARLARAAGVNRVSMGAQSFAPRWLAFLDRAHSAEQTRSAVATVRDAGFVNLSLDLMFGLPGQATAEWLADLEAALQLGTEHLSCYNLTFESGTRLEHARRRGEVQPNPAEIDREMFTLTRSRLADEGFTAYEISNFARAGKHCRHNDHYWLQGDYVGIGPGAASHRAGVRSTNLKPLDAWSSSLQRGLPPVAEAETLTARQRYAEALWLGLRRSDGIDLDTVGARLGTREAPRFASVLDELAAAGWIARDGTRVALTGEGLLFADSVGARLLCA